MPRLIQHKSVWGGLEWGGMGWCGVEWGVVEWRGVGWGGLERGGWRREAKTLFFIGRWWNSWKRVVILGSRGGSGHGGRQVGPGTSSIIFLFSHWSNRTQIKWFQISSQSFQRVQLNQFISLKKNIENPERVQLNLLISLQKHWKRWEGSTKPTNFIKNNQNAERATNFD